MATPSVAERVELLRAVGSLAYRVSPHQDGWRSHSIRSYYCQALFARLFDIATSILRLTDVSDGEPKAENILDPASIASLTRNILEANDAFWHLVVERISKSERDLRHAVWGIHHHTEAKKVADVLEPEYSRLWEIHEALRLTRILEVRENERFRALSEETQAAILRGRRPYVGRISRTDRGYLSDERARAFYKYLSNQTHSHPFGIHTSMPARFEPSFGRSYLLSACLDLTARELALATHDYVRRMRRCDGMLDGSELELLASVPLAPWNITVS